MFQTQGRMMEQAEEDDDSKESEASEKSIDRAGDVLLVLSTDTLRVGTVFSVTYFVSFFFFFFPIQTYGPHASASMLDQLDYLLWSL